MHGAAACGRPRSQILARSDARGSIFRSAPNIDLSGEQGPYTSRRTRTAPNSRPRHRDRARSREIQSRAPRARPAGRFDDKRSVIQLVHTVLAARGGPCGCVGTSASGYGAVIACARAASRPEAASGARAPTMRAGRGGATCRGTRALSEAVSGAISSGTLGAPPGRSPARSGRASRTAAQLISARARARAREGTSRGVRSRCGSGGGMEGCAAHLQMARPRPRRVSTSPGRAPGRNCARKAAIPISRATC